LATTFLTTAFLTGKLGAAGALAADVFEPLEVEPLDAEPLEVADVFAATGAALCLEAFDLPSKDFAAGATGFEALAAEALGGATADV
jgi:hypothetical protein